MPPEVEHSHGSILRGGGGWEALPSMRGEKKERKKRMPVTRGNSIVGHYYFWLASCQRLSNPVGAGHCLLCLLWRLPLGRVVDGPESDEREERAGHTRLMKRWPLQHGTGPSTLEAVFGTKKRIARTTNRPSTVSHDDPG